MTVTIAEVMRHVRNYFVTGCISGRWELQGGRLLPEGLVAPGAWIAIPCPFDEPGVWQLDENGGLPDAADTAWEGEMWLLNPPADFLRLCGEINQWAQHHADPALTGEKFSLYSRQLRDSRWQIAFDAALAPYMRMYPEVKV